MGIHDRDYYRDGGGGLFDAWGRQGATVWLIVITCVVFVAQVVTRDLDGPVAAGRAAFADSPVGEVGVYNPQSVLDGQVWRLLTAVFLHAGPWHLAFNMFFLYWAGSRVEELYGGREFLLFYLTAGVAANLLNLLLYAAGAVGPVPSLGASGAVTAVLVLYACRDPHHQVSLFFVVTVPLWGLVVFFVVMDAFGAFGFGNRGIGYVVHLGGAGFGYLYYRAGWRIAGLVPGRPARLRAGVAPKLRIVVPDPLDADPRAAAAAIPAAAEPPPRAAAGEPFEAKVDRVLEKVSKYGQDSLTPEERETLFRASEVYKNRRK